MMAVEDEPEVEIAAESRADFDHAVYAAITVAARLRDIRLIESSFRVKPELFEAIEDFEKMGQAFGGIPIAFDFNAETGIAIGEYEWVAEIKWKRKKVLKFSAAYLIAYTDLMDFEASHVKFFFEKVGRFATYPYFRAEFSQHCASSGIMLPPLPSLNERVN